MNERLIEYIRRNFALGHHPEKIKRVLLNSGWNAEVVEAHLKHALGFKPKKSFADSIKHELASNSEKYFITGLIAVFVIVSFFMGLNHLFDFGNRNGDKKEIAIAETFEPDENAQNVLNRALISNDPAICNQIVDSLAREECKKWFFRNETACDERCEDSNIFNLAIINNNESLCAGITDEKIKQDCMGIINKEDIIKNPESSCDQACKDNQILNFALINQNSSICPSITDSSIQNQCIEIFSKRGE